MMWTIYYENETINGRTIDDWCNAPNDKVQVIVLWETPSIFERPWTGVSDRYLWTGDDYFDPFGFGLWKTGSLISDEDYFRIWNRAAYGEKP